MRLLVDSHVFVWLLYEPDKITDQWRTHIGTAEAVSVSIASLWELTLKHSKGKLRYGPAELTAGVDALNLELLPLKPEHLQVLPAVKLPHADPFDSLLVAQCQAEGCTLMTADSLLLQSAYVTV